MFYGLGFNIGRAYYEQWQDNTSGATQTQTWDGQSKTDNLPWTAAGGALAVSLSAGFTGIALGKRRKQYYTSSSYGSSYRSSDDGFWWGYMLGNSNSRSSGSSSSSSSDNGGAAAAIVIVGAAALAASASVVSYKALKANFGSEGP